MDYRTSFSTKLRIKLQLAHNSKKDSNTILPPKQNAQTWFKDYLIVTHSIIRSSVPLMQAAYEQCSHLQEQRKLISDLRRYYKKHVQEETNHDEWLLDDLESIGVSRQESLSRKPLQAVAELVGSQYYWIYHWHPVCLLGYIALLEGDPPRKELVEQLQKSTGYPDTAFRTIVKHSDLDPYHRDDLNKLLETLPLETKHEQWITYNALYSANKLIEIRNQ
jgi:Iron-containing redox enzyme